MRPRREPPSGLELLMLIVATMVIDRAWPGCFNGLAFNSPVDGDPDGARR